MQHQPAPPLAMRTILKELSESAQLSLPGVTLAGAPEGRARPEDYCLDAYAVAQILGSDVRWVTERLAALAIDLERLAYEAAHRAAELAIGTGRDMSQVISDPGPARTLRQRVRRLRWRRLDLVESIRKLQQGQGAQAVA